MTPLQSIILLLTGLGLLAYGVIALRRRARGSAPRRSRSRTGSSLDLAASSNPPKGLPEATDTFAVAPKGDDVVRYGCGHDGPADFVWDLYGEHLPPADRLLAERDKCPQCILGIFKEKHIRCVLCGLAIMPGEPVAVYGGGKGFRKKIATRTPSGGWIGCMRWDCCPSGGFFSGHWTGDAFRPAFTGGMSVAAAAFSTGKPIMGTVGDDGQMRITVLDDEEDPAPKPAGTDPPSSDD